MNSEQYRGVTDMVVPLFVVEGNDVRGLGTAIVIAAYGQTALALTARHVMDPVMDALQSRPPKYPRVREVQAVVGFGESSFVAQATRVTRHGISDLAFIRLHASPGRAFNAAIAIDPSPVPVGLFVRASGYSHLSASLCDDRTPGIARVTHHSHLSMRPSTVRARCSNGIRRIKWPVVQVDTPFDSTMSGGPLLELRGNELVVRAVICSDMSEGADLSRGDGGEAYASEIWPALPARLLGDTLHDPGATLLELIAAGGVADRGGTLSAFAYETSDGPPLAKWNGEVIWTGERRGEFTGWLPGR